MASSDKNIFLALSLIRTYLKYDLELLFMASLPLITTQDM